MTRHVHEFKKRVVTYYDCDCGADGHPCEACTRITGIDDMRADAEGCWFCPKCWAEMTSESP